ncbi:MAG: Kelch repeat-containing protein [Polyangiales bacterium]
MKTLQKILFPALVVTLGSTVVSTLPACATANEEDPGGVVPAAETGGSDSSSPTDSASPTDSSMVDSAPAVDTGVAMDSLPGDGATCVYPKTETRACGACGSQSRFCLPDNVFTGWTDCVGEKGDTECKVGEKRSTDCGNCGKSTDFCDPKECVWISGLCAGEGPCAPGDSETTKASCSVADTIRTRTCDDKCQWSEFSACDLPRGWITPAMTKPTISGRGFHSAVWTGSKMLVWGGGTSSTVYNDGAAYDMGTNSWKTLATSGLSTRRQHMTAWTGSQMIVWGGRNSSPYKDGSIYDPSTDSWTATATSPLSARHSAAVAWSTTTSQMIVWGGCTSGWCSAVANDGASYDPATSTWTALPAAPIAGRTDPLYAWTGSELVIWGGRSATNVALSDGARFDPKTGVWTKFSDPAAAVLDARFDAAFGNDGSGNLFVFGGRSANDSSTPNSKSNGAIYQPGIGFVAIPAVPDGLFAPSNKRYNLAGFIAGKKLFVFDGIPIGSYDTPKAGFAIYDFAAGTWSDGDRTGAPTTARSRASIVWTGREAIVWGGINGNESGSGYNDGAIYRP